MNKTCNKCHTSKPIAEFWRRGRTKDGLHTFCKLCCLAVKRESGYYRSEARKAYSRRWFKTNPDKRKKALLEYKSRNLLKVRAREAVNNAVRDGILERRPCENCKCEKSQAHHYAGYEPENWLNVQWLCSSHHAEVHFTH